MDKICLTRNMRIAKLPNCQERMIRMLSNAKGKTFEENFKDVGSASLAETGKVTP